MSKCYHTYEKGLGKILVPECMAVAHSYDIEDCTCPKSFALFEKERYNKTLKKYQDHIETLEQKIERLTQIIESK